MSYTTAYLAVPRAAWETIAHALEQSGYARDQITQIGDMLTVSINMDGIALVPDGDSDTFINSGRLSDLLAAIGEEAFRAGYTAGMKYGCDYGDLAGSYYDAWSDYTPSDDIQELEKSL